MSKGGKNKNQNKGSDINEIIKLSFYKSDLFVLIKKGFGGKNEIKKDLFMFGITKFYVWDY